MRKGAKINPAPVFDSNNKPPAIKYNHADILSCFPQISTRAVHHRYDYECHARTIVRTGKVAQKTAFRRCLFRRISAGALYSTDASIYQIQPLGVVVPRTRDDVVCAVQAAVEHGVSIIPRGGGTSLSGQSIGAGLIIDFSKYMRAIEIDPTSRTARVQPGVVLDQLNAAAAPLGLQFGPDVATSSRANVGGMIGNNSAGARSIWHGKSVDSVIALDVVLSDASVTTFGPLTSQELGEQQARADLVGQIHRDVARIVAENRDEIIARFPPLLRRVSGYNLDEFVPECRGRYPTPRLLLGAREREARMYPGANFNLAKLLVGGEGTLGTITETLVHLLPLPKVRGIVVLHFDSLAHAVASVGPILECDPSAAELLDGLILRLAEKSLEYRHYLDFVVGQPESLVLVEFSGETPQEVKAKADELVGKLRGQPGLFHALQALEKKLCDHVWACRKAALPLLLGVPGTRKPVAFVEDAAVAPEHLPRFVERFCEIMARHGTDGRVLRPRLGRLPAHSPDARFAEAGRNRPFPADLAGSVRPGAGVRRRDERRARRRTGAQLPERKAVWLASLSGIQANQSGLRSAQPHEPGQSRRRPQPGREPALRHGLSHDGRAHHVRFQPRRGIRPRGRAVQWGGRVPQVADRHDVPFVHGHRATKSTARAAGPMPCGWSCPARCRRKS